MLNFTEQDLLVAFKHGSRPVLHDFIGGSIIRDTALLYYFKFNVKFFSLDSRMVIELCDI